MNQIIARHTGHPLERVSHAPTATSSSPPSEPWSTEDMAQIHPADGVFAGAGKRSARRGSGPGCSPRCRNPVSRFQVPTPRGSRTRERSIRNRIRQRQVARSTGYRRTMPPTWRCTASRHHPRRIVRLSVPVQEGLHLGAQGRESTWSELSNRTALGRRIDVKQGVPGRSAARLREDRVGGSSEIRVAECQTSELDWNLRATAADVAFDQQQADRREMVTAIEEGSYIGRSSSRQSIPGPR
jgi:hypothetical protein